MGECVAPFEVKRSRLCVALFFLTVTSLYLLQPVKDAVAVRVGGISALPSLYGLSLCVMLVYDWLFGRGIRLHPNPLSLTSSVLSAFAGVLVLFFLLLATACPWEEGVMWSSGVPFVAGYLFFLWMSIQSLVPVVLCWCCFVHVHKETEARNTFATIGIGGSCGQLFGSLLAAGVTMAPLPLISLDTSLGYSFAYLSPPWLLLLAATFLLGARMLCLQLYSHCSDRKKREDHAPPERIDLGAQEQSLGSLLLEPFHIGLCAYLVIQSVINTLVYFRKIALVSQPADPLLFFVQSGTTSLSASLYAATSALTLLLQLLATKKLLIALPLSALLCIVPLVNVAAFVLLFYRPMLSTFFLTEAVRKASNYAVGRPSRELLYVRVRSQSKYRLKSFVETVLYKLGDGTAASSLSLLHSLISPASQTLASTAIAVVFCLSWVGVALFLGDRRTHGVP